MMIVTHHLSSPPRRAAHLPHHYEEEELPPSDVSCLSWLYGHSVPPSAADCRRIMFLSPGDKAARVESVRGWRAQQRAERDAGIVSSMSQVLIPFFRCTLCGICIGPGYYEQDLYVYAVPPGETICLRDDAMHTFADGVWLLCCGGCAHHQRRALPEFFRLVDATCWTTTRLIAGEGERIRASRLEQEASLLRAAITQYVLARLQFILALMALSIGGNAFLFPLLPALHLLTPRPIPRKRTNTHRVPIREEEGEEQTRRDFSAQETESSALLLRFLTEEQHGSAGASRHLHPQVQRSLGTTILPALAAS